MSKTLLALLPLFLELKNLSHSSSKESDVSGLALMKIIKSELQSLIAKLAAAVFVLGLMIFAAIRILQRIEVAVSAMDNGDVYLLIGHVLIVLLGASFFVFLYSSKSESKVKESEPSVSSNQSPANLESIVSALVVGFYEGLSKEQKINEPEPTPNSL